MTGVSTREVYRVEDKYGNGPYACWDATGLSFQQAMEEMGVGHDLSYRHPTACTSKLTKSHYGFPGMAELRSWFDYFGEHGYDVLRRHDMRIAVYEVPADYVVIRYPQLMFDPRHAACLREEDL